MKRSLVAALILGAIVSAIVIAAHATHLLRPLEEPLMRALAGNHPTTRVVSAKLQYPLVLLAALGAAWLVVVSRRPRSLAIPLVILVLEVVAIGRICLLYQTAFQPLLIVAALVLGFLAGYIYKLVRGRSRSALARDYFSGRVSDEHRRSIVSGEVPFTLEPRSYNTTAVVCDIANKHDLAEECPPAVLGEITEKFIREATASFLKAGAYIETITGEGIVAIFGFPGADEGQAEKATRHALTLLQDFDKMRQNGKDDVFKKFNVHVGISSGTTIMGPLTREW